VAVLTVKVGDLEEAMRRSTKPTIVGFSSILAWPLLVACFMTWPMESAPAQTPSSDSATAPVTVKLTDEQRTTIYQSVSTTAKNDPAPPGFRPAVGAHVPGMIELKPMPETLAKLIPAAKAFEVGMVEKQVILVEPQSKIIVAVITEGT